MYSFPKLYWLGFTFCLTSRIASNCIKLQTCFSALVLADSSCASTISRSAVICTLSLSASSSSSILSSFLRRLSWKMMEDQVKQTNQLTRGETIYQERTICLLSILLFRSKSKPERYLHRGKNKGRKELQQEVEEVYNSEQKAKLVKQEKLVKDLFSVTERIKLC